MLLNTINIYVFHAITHEPVLMFVEVTTAERELLIKDLMRAGLDGKTMIKTSIGEITDKTFYWNEA